MPTDPRNPLHGPVPQRPAINIGYVLLAGIICYGCSICPNRHQEPTATSPVPRVATVGKPRTILYHNPSTGRILYSDAGIRVQQQGVPEYVHKLPRQPKAREQELQHGTWLVLAYCLVSTPDILCISEAILAVEPWKGAIQLGIRPFADYDESETWYQPYGSSGSPMWLIIRDNKILREEKGLMTRGQIVNMLNETLNKND